MLVRQADLAPIDFDGLDRLTWRRLTSTASRYSTTRLIQS
jgi:hypothetical protein